MPRGPQSLPGKFGDIPDEIILRKNEATCLREDPLTMENHMRNILKDYSPDRPFMASDEPRSGNYDPRTGEMRRGGSWSKERLSLRGIGRRSFPEPYLPDGTFLDHIGGGLEKDPRSISTDPDFKEYDKQRKFRGRYIKFSNDDDMSIPESGIHPAEYIKMIKDSQKWSKKRMKWFDTAKDNMTSRRKGQSIPKEHRKVQVTIDGEIINISDAQNRNKINLTSLLTNKQKVGQRLPTIDQTFKVAKYGQIKPSMKISDQLWYKNIRKGIDDRKDEAKFQDQSIPKTLVLMLENIIKARDIKQKSTGGIPQRSYIDQINYKTNLKAANYRGGKVGYQSVEDRAEEIVRLLQNTYINRKNAMLAAPDKPDSRIGLSWVDPAIIRFMDLSNRKIGPTETKMVLIEAAKLAGAQSGINVHDKQNINSIPVSINSFLPTEVLWNSKDFKYVNRPLSITNYTNIKPEEKQQIHLVNGENYKSRINKIKYKLFVCYMIKPHGQLVQVSSTHYCAYTPCLSTL